MSNNLKIKILVVAHKEVPVLTGDIYLPVQVGVKLSGKKISLPWVGDDTGDNISEKNKEYCELTGLYWAWKNLKDVEYVGLCHYRRYFYPTRSDFSNILRKILRGTMYLGAALLPQRISRECSFSNVDNLAFENFSKKQNEINKNLISKINKSDIILPTKVYLSKFSIRQHYAMSHNIDDFNVMIDILCNEFNYNRKQLEKIMKNHSFDLCNMAIMKKEVLNEYCEWLFSTLNKVESRISYDKRTIQQRRVLGFLAERMLHIWIEVNKKRFKINRMKCAFINNL